MRFFLFFFFNFFFFGVLLTVVAGNVQLLWIQFAPDGYARFSKSNVKYPWYPRGGSLKREAALVLLLFELNRISQNGLTNEC